MALLVKFFPAYAILLTVLGLTVALGLRAKRGTLQKTAGVRWWVVLLAGTVLAAGYSWISTGLGAGNQDLVGGQAAMDRSRDLVLREVNRAVSGALPGVEFTSEWSGPFECAAWVDGRFDYEYEARSGRMWHFEAQSAASAVEVYWREVFGDRRWSHVVYLDGGSIRVGAQVADFAGTPNQEWVVSIHGYTRCVAIPPEWDLMGIVVVWLVAFVGGVFMTWRAGRPEPVEENDEGV